MAYPQTKSEIGLPGWLTGLVSVAVAGHFVAIGALVLSAPSGQWPSNFGPTMAPPPPFAAQINNVFFDRYLKPLKLTHNYHFTENRPAFPGVYFEVHLYDDAGAEVKHLKFPDGDACFWMRHRQEMLARALADDRPVEPQGGVQIAAPGQKDRTVTFWEPTGPQKLMLKTTPEHLVPRDRPVMRPSDWSTVLAASYVRFLCREHGAASGELIRTTREPIQMDAGGPSPDLVATFKEISQ